MIALQDCSITRSPDGLVEVAEAAPARRGFPSRVTEQFGVCLKIGPDHEVLADGRTLRFPADSICVRPAGCVWGVDDTGPVGFLSVDLDASLLPRVPLRAEMTFVPSAAVPGFAALARALGRASARRAAELTCELVLALADAGAVVPDELRDRARAGCASRARDAIEAHVADPPSVVELARDLGTNRFALTRAFNQRFGVPPHAFAILLRIERARERLAQGQDPARVALELGFADQSHLTRAFKRVVGIPPGEYARQVRALSFKSPVRSAPTFTEWQP